MCVLYGYKIKGQWGSNCTLTNKPLILQQKFFNSIVLGSGVEDMVEGLSLSFIPLKNMEVGQYLLSILGGNKAEWQTLNHIFYT